jgi:hypothetical protein
VPAQLARVRRASRAQPELQARPVPRALARALRLRLSAVSLAPPARVQGRPPAVTQRLLLMAAEPLVPRHSLSRADTTRHMK